MPYFWYLPFHYYFLSTKYSIASSFLFLGGVCVCVFVWFGFVFLREGEQGMSSSFSVHLLYFDMFFWS